MTEKLSAVAKPTEKTVPINIPTLLACSLFASKEETRFYLNGVFVEARKHGVFYAATDGHRLLTRFIADPEVTAGPSIIIPTRIARGWKVIKDDPSGGMGSLTFGNPKCTITYDQISVGFAPIDGTFPQVGKVVPESAVLKPAQFNGKYIAEFTKAADILGAGLPHFHHNAEGPAAVTFSADQNIIGVLMPMRNEADAFSRPDWIKQDSAQLSAVA
jgi:DNA polymerase III sliding clamp (beta) subunit (PCNA family)